MLQNLNANTLGPKRMVQMLLGAAALVLVIGGIIIFLMNSQIQDMQATVTGKEALVGTNEQTAQKYEQTQKDYDAIATRTQYLEASVSAKSFVPTLLKQLQVLATTTHLTVTAVRPGPIMSAAPPSTGTAAPAAGAGDASAADTKKAPPLPYDTLDISVDVVGTYADTAAFLYNLTRFPKIVSVASVQMHPGGDAGAPGGTPTAPVLTTSLHLTAFVFHSDANAPEAVDGTTTPATTIAAVGSPGASATALPSDAAVQHVAPLGAVSNAAAHAAGQAVGVTKATQARSEVGIQTL